MPLGGILAEVAGYIASTVLAFFPARYRATMGIRGPAIASAMIEGFLAVGFLIGRIYSFVSHPGMVSDNLAKQLYLEHEGKFFAANAISGAANFWMDPLVLLYLYFFLESVVRGFAAIEGNSTIGTLPLYSISLVHGLWDRASHKRYLGELVADRIFPGSEEQGYDVQVQSCRPKLDWNRYMTVEFRGEYFECFKEEQGPPPRRFVYYLRKSPDGRLVVVIRKYKPDDVLSAALQSPGR
ncbi:MAG TPA: hypothetical protein VK210_05050 [Terriglobia bacterium]|nr:hypothetical protein [Terriglobia bacterium]